MLVQRRPAKPHAHGGRHHRMQHRRVVRQPAAVEHWGLPAKPRRADHRLPERDGGAEPEFGLRVRERDVCADVV